MSDPRWDGPVAKGGWVIKPWNMCTECDRYIPCRVHPDAGCVGPVPPHEVEDDFWTPADHDGAA